MVLRALRETVAASPSTTSEFSTQNLLNIYNRGFGEDFLLQEGYCLLNRRVLSVHCFNAYRMEQTIAPPKKINFLLSVRILRKGNSSMSKGMTRNGVEGLVFRLKV